MKYYFTFILFFWRLNSVYSQETPIYVKQPSDLISITFLQNYLVKNKVTNLPIKIRQGYKFSHVEIIGGIANYKDSMLQITPNVNRELFLKIFVKDSKGKEIAAFQKAISIISLSVPDADVDGIKSDSFTNKMRIVGLGHLHLTNGNKRYNELNQTYEILNFCLRTNQDTAFATGNHINKKMRYLIDDTKTGESIDFYNIQYKTGNDTAQLPSALRIYMQNDKIFKF